LTVLGEIGVAFVVEVAQTTGQVQVVVDSPVFDAPTSVADALRLFLVIGFVIF
jgi:hypothetical protein